MARRTALTVVVVVAVLGGGLGLALAEHSLSGQMDAEMTENVATLLPGGHIDSADMVDDPALFAALAQSWDYTAVVGTDRSGEPVEVNVFLFDRASKHAETVNWSLVDRPFASGLLTGRFFGSNIGEGVIDGHRVTAQIVAFRTETTVVVQALGVTIDGEPVDAENLPDAVRSALAPAEFALPIPIDSLEVHEVWFEESTITVHLTANQVPLGTTT